MLKKQFRLKKDKEFRQVFKSGQFFRTENLVLRVSRINSNSQILNSKSPLLAGSRHQAGQIPNSINNVLTPKSYPTSSRQSGGLRGTSKLKANNRFGFVVSNKIDKRASRRNGLKRRLRAIIQELQPEIKSGYSLVIQVAKPFEYPFDFQKIREQVKEGLAKAKLLQ